MCLYTLLLLHGGRVCTRVCARTDSELVLEVGLRITGFLFLRSRSVIAQEFLQLRRSFSPRSQCTHTTWNSKQEVKPITLLNVECWEWITSTPAYPGPGRRGSSLSRDTQTSFSLATSSSSSMGIPRWSQGTSPSWTCQKASGLSGSRRQRPWQTNPSFHIICFLFKTAFLVFSCFSHVTSSLPPFAHLSSSWGLTLSLG